MKGQKTKYTDSLLKAKLKEHFGFKDFRGTQSEAIKSILAHNDTFIIMPTGGGKSLCYQLPAMLMDGCAIVLSPLIALMKNQVDLMTSYSKNPNIAQFLNSTLNKSKVQEVKDSILSGETKLLYAAPETLVKQDNIDFLKQIKLSFFAVDEAHCISEWGHDFRPEYRKIREIINDINPKCHTVALTATATPKVQKDIIKNLNLKKPTVLISSFDRENLYYEVQPKTSREQAIKHMVTMLRKKKNASAIVYVLSRKSTEEIAEVFNSNEITAVAYHAGLDNKTRNGRQDAFIHKEVQVIVATIAFGMGIDKPDVRYIFHFNIPKSVENYYQETGRAGRDGLPSKCVLFYAHSDFLKFEYLIKQKPPMYLEIMEKLIEEMGFFVENGACRRKFLLNYFGERHNKENCGNCDNCLNPREKVETKAETVMLLRLIQTTQEAFTAPHLIDILRGNASSKVQMYNHEKLDLFSKGKHKDVHFWYSLIIQLNLIQMIKKDLVQFGVIKLLDNGLSFLSKPTSLKIALNHKYKEITSQTEEHDLLDEGMQDTELFDELYSLRATVAKKNNLPDYIIFTENALIDMSTYYPTTLKELEKCQGINTAKANKFGKSFIQHINEYVSKRNIQLDSRDIIIRNSSFTNKIKLNIIQQIDKKINLNTIADSNKIGMADLLKEMEGLTLGGTKINLDYLINEEFSDEELDEIFDYLKENQNGNLEELQEELDYMDYSIEQLQLAKIKFINDYSF